MSGVWFPSSNWTSSLSTLGWGDDVFAGVEDVSAGVEDAFAGAEDEGEAKFVFAPDAGPELEMALNTTRMFDANEVFNNDMI